MTGRPATIALTGGSGFIGKRFAAVARARGYRIRQLTRRASEEFDADDEVRGFDLELGDDNTLALQGCRTLVHLAAFIPRDHDDPAAAERCWRINAWGTLQLIEAAARAGIDKVIQTTSANAYAASASVPDEDAALFPQSRGYYLGSKMLQELYAGERCRAKGMALTTLRLGSVYGAGQTTGALAAMVRAAIEERRINVSDGGRFGADMVHLHDVVDTLMLAITTDCPGVINVGSGVRTTIAELARMLAGLTGADVIEGPAAGENHDAGFPALGIGRLRALGCRPRPVSEGVVTMIEACAARLHPPMAPSSGSSRSKSV